MRAPLCGHDRGAALPLIGENREMRLLLTRHGWLEDRIDDHISAVRSTIDSAAHVRSAASDSDFRALRGAWARIAKSDAGITLTQDPIRSFPLFYAVERRDGTAAVTVSDEIRTILEHTGKGEVDPTGAEEFRAFGFVTGARTLHYGIRQVQAGESVTIRPDGRIESSFYRSLRYTGENVHDYREVDHRFQSALDETTDALLSRLDGRQLVVPLSGGLDSRLLAVELHNRGYENVVNFTYGVGEAAETSVSRSVSQALGQRWEFMPYSAERIRRLWSDESTVAFLYDGYAGASLPHIQDWLAVHDMREREIIDADAVFLPGHTVVGNVHDAGVFDEPGSVSPEQITRIILNKNARLQPDSYRRMLASDEIRTKMRTLFDRISYDGSPDARLRAIEYWNFLERQTKYINNSMRGYEHFGYDWALPMLESPVIDAWATFAPQITRDRDWYTAFVNTKYAIATGTALPTFEPTALKTSTRDRMKRALRAFGVLELAERVASARASAHHPMAFSTLR